jgi:DNA-binding LacI/PurR family transcriptional regulator
VLSSTPRATAIVYDNDVMAVAGLSVAREMGLEVPRDLSLVACDDSPLCQVVRPALTVLSRDVDAYGAHAVRLLFESIDGGTPGDVQGQKTTLVVRESTGIPHVDTIRLIR